MNSEATTVLGDHVELQRGTTYKSRLLGAPGPVLLGLASIERNGGFRDDNLKTYGGESPDKLLLVPGDLYVSLKDVTQSADLLGAVARVPPNVECGRLTQDTVKLVVKNASAPPAFLYWILRTPQYRAYCHAHSMGTTNLSLSREDFLAFPLPPATSDRMKLVEVLEFLDRKLDSNHRLASLLEQAAAEIFRASFVDFVGIEEFDESEIGRVPKGWRVGQLKEIAFVHRETINGTNDGPYIGLDAMPRGSTVLATWMTENTPTGQASLFETGDVLFGKLRPYFHKVGVAPVAGRCSTEILVLRSVSADMYGVVLGHVASNAFIEYCVAVSRGTKMPRAEWRDAGSFAIAIPPPDDAARYTKLVRTLYEQIRCLIHESHVLTAVRDCLLPKLMSGRIRLHGINESDHAAEPASEAVTVGRP